MNFLCHYLYDFHTLGPPNSGTCQHNLDTCVRMFREWGIPLHPSTYLTMLGIELDSVQLQARLLQEKFDCTLELLNSWLHRQHCTRKDL